MKRALWRYGLPVACTAAALGLRVLLDPVLGSRIPYATFYVAVMVSAVVGGALPGMIATFLGAWAAAYFILQPRYSMLIASPDEQLGLALDLIVSTVLVALADLQRRAQLRLRRSEETERAERQRFEVTLASIGDGVIATDREGRITFLNGVAANLTGWTAAEASGQPVETVFAIRNEDTGATVENPAARTIREGKIVGLANHTVLVCRDGTRRPIDDSGAPILDPAGRVVGAVLVFRDISAARLRESELRSRNRMIDLSHDAIIVMDRERRIVSWNRGAREVYGWEEDEVRGKISHTLLQTRADQPTEKIDEIVRLEGRWDGELIHTCKEGQEIVVDSRQVLLRDLGEEAAAILEINRNITDRKRAEEELRRTAMEAEEGRRTLEALLEHTPEALAIADAPDARIRLVSRHAEELTGRKLGSLLNTTAGEQPSAWGLYHADGKTLARPEELPLARAVRTGEITPDEEWVIRRPGGETVLVSGQAAPILDGQGHVTGALVTWRDISERKRLEQKLREGAKLESLGVLAGGVAHDFNNLLTGVLGNASLLEDALPEGSTIWSYAHNIAGAAEHASHLSQQMLAYSGHGRFVVELLDLSDYIRGTKPLVESSIPKHVKLALELEEHLPRIEADASQIQQVILNLAVNGAEAIPPPGGRLTIATRTVAVDELYIRSELLEEIRPGTYVVLEVSDTGCGMDEETLARIFDPFFTTKFMGRGLGLAAVQGIVRGHKGAIRVDSAPGRGTTFRILFPAASGAGTQATPKPGAGERANTGRETVLVIDDEEIVRSTASQALRHLGYAVVTASDGAEGIEVFRALQDRIAVVLLDMTMPGMSGEDTLRELQAIRPDVPVVLSSGFEEAEAMRRFRRHRLAGFLQKPYSVKALAACVRAAAEGFASRR